MKLFFQTEFPSAWVLMSGNGSNAETLLSDPSREQFWHCSVLVTDRPETSGARRLAEKYDLPLVEHDIKAFYRERGLSTTRTDTPEGRAVRKEWTQVLREKLKPYPADFAILAGFFSLTNLVGDLPSLNIHPGDLTELDESGKRIFTGLNRVPVERAILAGREFLRASVLIVRPCTGKPEDVDAGLLPGISAQVPVDLEGHSRAELRQIASGRTGGVPAGGDLFSRLADRNQELLKRGGDLKVLPQVVRHFARGDYALSDTGTLLFRPEGGRFEEIFTVEFTDQGPVLHRSPGTVRHC